MRRQNIKSNKTLRKSAKWLIALAAELLSCAVVVGAPEVALASKAKSARMKPSTAVPDLKLERLTDMNGESADEKHCLQQDFSLLASLIPSDSQVERVRCAANGLDILHRVAKPRKFSREAVLGDISGRITEEFLIPEGLEKRVGFWFDIYTKYPSYTRVLHHSRYPWIKYKVFDLTDFLAEPRILWMNMESAENFVRREKRELVGRLERLGAKRDFSALSPDERYLFELLAEIPGPRKKVLREAARSVRVQIGQMDYFVEALVRKHEYLDMMEKTFRDYGLPTELTRLPLVESSFNPYATSKVGAAGIWQFMPTTARSIMKVSTDVDERRSPFKATLGAARYLASTFRMLYRSWPLTIVAYNHGPGGVRKAVRTVNSHEIGELIDNYDSRSFSFATKNYYPEFLAALHAEKYQQEIFGNLSMRPKIRYETTKIMNPIRPSLIAHRTGLPINVILGFNLDIESVIQNNKALPKGHVLYLPEGFGDALDGYEPSPSRSRPVARNRR